MYDDDKKGEKVIEHQVNIVSSELNREKRNAKKKTGVPQYGEKRAEINKGETCLP